VQPRTATIWPTGNQEQSGDFQGLAQQVTDDLLDRSELAGAQCLVALVHLTDMHVIDASSPARVEHLELVADDPVFAPMSPMHRPHELLANHALQALVDTINTDPIAPVSGRQFDLALLTGDCIDNAQHNELGAYLSIVGGGTWSLPYDGVQSVAAASEHGFWCPEPDVVDRWKTERGFPAFPGLLKAIDRPVTSGGLGVPFRAVLGNHDVMRQGTAFSTPALEKIAVGAFKASGLPSGFRPADVVGAYLKEPAQFNIGAPQRGIAPDPGRRVVTNREWVHVHGYDSHDAVLDVEGVRLITLDTNHPGGNFNGSLGRAQLAWLEDRIRETTSVVILASHHGPASLDNTTWPIEATEQERAERLLAEEIRRVLHSHSQVIAWLSGHRHVHRVQHLADPEGRNEGIWSITTASVIDWPSQARSVEVLKTRSGKTVIVCTPIDHAGPTMPTADAVESIAGLASIHRLIAANAAGGDVGLRRRSGSYSDRSCVLVARS
jgi:metallophosphoesterase (TIGR03767 family)